MKTQQPEWYNVRQKLPVRRCSILVKMGDEEFGAQRIGLLNDYWLYDSGFIEPISQYDLWRPR